jgi:hypothetical protein
MASSAMRLEERDGHYGEPTVINGKVPPPQILVRQQASDRSVQAKQVLASSGASTRTKRGSAVQR